MHFSNTLFEMKRGYDFNSHFTEEEAKAQGSKLRL